MMVETKGAPDYRFWGLFRARFMTPTQRERYIARVGFKPPVTAATSAE